MPEAGVPRWVVLAGVITLTVCFVAAYHSGVNAQQRETAVPLQTLRRQLDELSSKTQDCGRQYSKASARALRGKNSSLLDALAAANATQANLARDEKSIHESLSQCDAALRNQRDDIRSKKGGALQKSLQLAVLNAKLGALTKDITRVREGLGMQRALLMDALLTERRRHLKLLQKLGEPRPPNNAEYDAEIISRYAQNESATPVKAEDVAKEITADDDYHDVKVRKFLRNWREFRYSAAAHPDIFIPPEDAPTSNSSIPSPRYFGREPSGEENLGLALGRVAAPVRTTAFQVKAVVTVGLCAYRHNNTNLTFPTKFRRVSEQSTTEYLNETVQTPLVRFCLRCTSALRSALFRIACGRDRPRRLR